VIRVANFGHFAKRDETIQAKLDSPLETLSSISPPVHKVNNKYCLISVFALACGG
jgi:hypothetical protein